ncbi:MAG: hypothetical protein K2J79_06180 [Ruminiclostridium sp.]|nr:hypothetical protein [Ruminiclostridium sp.]
MNEDIKQKYTKIGGLLDEALRSTGSIDLEGEEENAELSAIKAVLKEMSESFKDEIDKLESSSEWDKFCIAYFGETNAGKSTIIESLRIIYNEESKWLEKRKADEEYKTELLKNSETYSGLLKALENINTVFIDKEANAGKAAVKNVFKKIAGALLLLIIGLIIGIIFF